MRAKIWIVDPDTAEVSIEIVATYGEWKEIADSLSRHFDVPTKARTPISQFYKTLFLALSKLGDRLHVDEFEL